MVEARLLVEVPAATKLKEEGPGSNTTSNPEKNLGSRYVEDKVIPEKPAKTAIADVKAAGSSKQESVMECSGVLDTLNPDDARHAGDDKLTGDLGDYADTSWNVASPGSGTLPGPALGLGGATVGVFASGPLHPSCCSWVKSTLLCSGAAFAIFEWVCWWLRRLGER